jgi:hypothetical protein
MNEPLLDAAYSLARKQFEAAVLAVFSNLDAQFPSTAFESVHHASERAMHLYFAALGFAQKVWAGCLSYDKAQEVLQAQFNEFPVSTCLRAFEDAYTQTR